MAFWKVVALALAALCVSNAAALERQNVAVYMVGEEPYGAHGAYKVLGGELARAISGSSKFSAIDRTDAILGQLSKEHIFQRSGAVSDEQIKALGRQFGVQYLCIVEISAIQGGNFYIDVRLVDVVTAYIATTITASSNLKNSEEMIRVARQIARELIDAEGVKKERKRENVKKKAFFVTGVTLDLLGAGAIAYGVYEDYNASGFIKDKNFTAAEDASGKRNLMYIAGCALLLSGISVHIFF
jgi:hypothetical protein